MGAALSATNCKCWHPESTYCFKPYFIGLLYKLDPPNTASYYCWFNSYQEIFICSTRFKSDGTTDRYIVYTNTIQLKSLCMVWFERWCGYFWGLTSLGPWLMIHLLTKNSYCSNFQLIRSVLLIQPDSIGIWLTWLYCVCFHICLAVWCNFTSPIGSDYLLHVKKFRTLLIHCL